MITIFQSIMLGAVQGITEFLPVSSSGHLVVIQQLFGWHVDGGTILAFDVALHLGTLLAVLIAFRRDIVDMLSGRAWRLAGLIIVGTIPAVIVGFTVKDAIDAMFSSVIVVGIAWIFTGTFLWLTKYIVTIPLPQGGRDGERGDNVSQTPLIKSLLIGCAQAVAIIPGISRSGSTIAAGIFLKMDKGAAARFAFLLAIPAIAGGALLKAKDLQNFPADGLPQLIIGTLVSFIVGYLSIKWLLALIQKGRLWWFGVYCWIAGISATALYFTHIIS
jgi:undecaprenyl-diphosphatase